MFQDENGNKYASEVDDRKLRQQDLYKGHSSPVVYVGFVKDTVGLIDTIIRLMSCSCSDGKNSRNTAKTSAFLIPKPCTNPKKWSPVVYVGFEEYTVGIGRACKEHAIAH
jgi:hypothetical protein